MPRAGAVGAGRSVKAMQRSVNRAGRGAGYAERMGRARGVRGGVALGLACAVAGAMGCAGDGASAQRGGTPRGAEADGKRGPRSTLEEETTPLGYVVAPSVATDAGGSVVDAATR